MTHIQRKLMSSIGGARSLLALLCLVMPSCSPEQSEAPSPAVLQQSVFRVGPPATVEPGEASTLSNSCPGRKLPDQCGSWAGVELRATRTAPSFGHHGSDTEGEHCLCQPIDFQVPKELPVSSGRSGWDWDKAELRFRTSSGRTVECQYKGNANPLGGHFGIPLGGDKYVLERCSNGLKAGQAARSDWFELELGHGHPFARDVAVELRLGEPDVVGGVLQEQIFYATDPRIAGAALHVPRGSAPGFETFSLELLPQVALGSVIPNGGSPRTTVSRAVDVHADSSDTFSFTPVSGACPRIELPYDEATLEGLLGPDNEAQLEARQLTSLDGIANGERVLASVGPVTVNLAQKTFSFCVEHLSYYIGLIAPENFDGALDSATIVSKPGMAVPLASTALPNPLPVLVANQQYTLTLGFANTGKVGTKWTSGGNIEVVPVTINDSGATVTTGSRWGVPNSTNTFSPSTVNPPSAGAFDIATFTFDLTVPNPSDPLNLCLHDAGSGKLFGTCFTWDPPGTPKPGRATVATCLPSPEICDAVDNDCDQQMNEENVCGSCNAGHPCSADISGSVPSWLYCANWVGNSAPNDDGTYTLTNTGTTDWHDDVGINIYMTEAADFISDKQTFLLASLKLPAGTTLGPNQSHTFTFCPEALPAAARYYVVYDVFAVPFGDNYGEFNTPSTKTLTWIGTKGG